MASVAAPTLEGERRSPNRALLVVGTSIGGGLAAALAAWHGWNSPTVSHSEATAILRGLLIASYVAFGAVTWWFRPTSRLGPLIVGAGFLYSAATLMASTNAWLFTSGRLALAGLVVYFLFLFTCFPRDRLETPVERRFVASAVATSVFVWAVVLAFTTKLPHGGPLTDCTQSCPDNPLQLVGATDEVSNGIGFAANAIGALLTGLVIVLLARKLRSQRRLRRRAVEPLLYASIVFAATYATYTLVAQASDDVQPAFRILAAVTAFSIPAALMIGQYRARLLVAASLWKGINSFVGQRVTPAAIEGFLGRALGDPTFRLASWDAAKGTYVDAHGEELDAAEAAGPGVTVLQKDGRPTLALIHDPSLADEPDLLRGVGSMAAMLLENASLVDELRASRARIVQSAERERRRLERDLHDGAQQRLMAIQLKLTLAREQVSDDLAEKLDEIATDAAEAVDELRTLAHGIYPGVLRERGLAGALASFAMLSPVPVQVVDRGAGRATSSIEAAAYYAVLEALQNASKHAGPGADVTVTLARDGDCIEFEVRDDGVGFDSSTQPPGLGLLSMEDRIRAVDGTLEVDSSPGRGTRVFGTVPAA